MKEKFRKSIAAILICIMIIGIVGTNMPVISAEEESPVIYVNEIFTYGVNIANTIYLYDYGIEQENIGKIVVNLDREVVCKGTAWGIGENLCYREIRFDYSEATSTVSVEYYDPIIEEMELQFWESEEEFSVLNLALYNCNEELLYTIVARNPGSSAEEEETTGDGSESDSAVESEIATSGDADEEVIESEIVATPSTATSVEKPELYDEMDEYFSNNENIDEFDVIWEMNGQNAGQQSEYGEFSFEYLGIDYSKIERIMVEFKTHSNSSFGGAFAAILSDGTYLQSDPTYLTTEAIFEWSNLTDLSNIYLKYMTWWYESNMEYSDRDVYVNRLLILDAEGRIMYAAKSMIDGSGTTLNNDYTSSEPWVPDEDIELTTPLSDEEIDILLADEEINHMCEIFKCRSLYGGAYTYGDGRSSDGNFIMNDESIDYDAVDRIIVRFKTTATVTCYGLGYVQSDDNNWNTTQDPENGLTRQFEVNNIGDRTVKGIVLQMWYSEADTEMDAYLSYFEVTDILLLDKDKNIIYGATTGAKVMTDSELEDGTEIVTENVTNNVEVRVTEVKELFNFFNSVLYEIHLEKDGNEVQPVEEMVIYLLIPEELVGLDLTVVYIDDDGNVIDMGAEVVNGFLAFVTDHFSNYAIVEKIIPPTENGDVDADGDIDSDDAIYLLYHSLLPEEYPLSEGCKPDFNGDATVDSDDAIYLLYHTLLPEEYPLKNGEEKIIL